MFHKRFISSAVLILGVAFVIFRAPWPVFMGVSVALVVVALKEFFNMMEHKGIRPLVFFGVFSGIVIMAVEFLTIHFPNLETKIDLTSLSHFLIVFGTLLVVLARFGQIQLIACAAITLTGIFYVAWLFSFLVKVRYFNGESGSWFLLFVLLTTKSTDIAAYCIGTLLGKIKLIPLVSPRKTVEGALGGMAGAIVVGLSTYACTAERLAPLTVWDAFVLSVVFGFFSQVGDIIESAIKRDAGVKDSGRILPGMGGILDLIDSVLVTAPLMYFYLLQRI